MDDHASRIAVKDGSGGILTYEQLNSRVNAIAGKLIHAGASQGSSVAVYQEPSADWVSSLLAILRIGAVYVPLDVRVPSRRLASIVEDSQAVVILAHEATLVKIDALEPRRAKTIDVTQLHKARAVVSSAAAKADLPAVLLYTSGTTGVPKGAIIRHRSLRNEVEGSARTFGIDHKSHVLQQSAHSFDISLWQTFLALTSGATLVIASPAQRQDPAALSELIISEEITTTIGTPSEYLSWLQYGNIKQLQNSRWSTAVSCGEKFKDILKESFRSLQTKDLRVFNSYGPCEVTFSSHEIQIDYVHDHSNDDTIPVGFTVNNASVYILDDDLNALPVGIPGEITIGGAGVASGYLNNDEQTKSRFLEDVFASKEFISRGWTTMYRTGDRGRLRPDGSLVFEGRIAGDTQVKLRGVRMELQDIERNIIQAANGDLIDAVVSVRGDSEFLVAHVTFAPDRAPAVPGGYLKRLITNLPLPEYMRPAVTVPLENMPLTKHSKTDRAAVNRLPLPDIPSWDQSACTLTDAELQMKSIWERILPEDVAKAHVIDENADFFQVGGNSMLSGKLQHEITKTFGVVIPLVRLFEASTLRGMATLVDKKGDKKRVAIDWTKETELSEDLLQTIKLLNPVSPREPRIVVLTGSTGFVGRSILQQLVNDEEVELIHCIAVRDSTTRALPSVFYSPKVKVHQGDLILPELGLSEDSIETIFSSADAIIHNGADVSFMKAYHSLKQVNFTPTKTLAQWSLHYRIPFHYISTAGIAHLTQLESFGESSAAAYFPPQDGSDGYTASKWASEVYLEKINRASGLPVWIHRPSSIMGEDPPETDLMANLLKFSLLTRTVPVIRPSSDGDGAALRGGFLDLIDVEHVAYGVTRHVRHQSDFTEIRFAEPSKIKYIHHSGEMVISLGALLEEAPVEEQDGASKSGFKALSLREWAAGAKALGLSDLLVELLQTTEERMSQASGGIGNLLVYPRLLKGTGEE
ncbi:hypothetical protein VTN77DRAFT_4673 [Rasamsonia byssochlamydoides]|uniref:uncharacterized protein n=1 Tax=Rasamsonia byssochlamydoides TaxID=89139 RepID=UPI00374251A0